MDSEWNKSQGSFLFSLLSNYQKCMQYYINNVDAKGDAKFPYLNVALYQQISAFCSYPHGVKIYNDIFLLMIPAKIFQFNS